LDLTTRRWQRWLGVFFLVLALVMVSVFVFTDASPHDWLLALTCATEGTLQLRQSQRAEKRDHDSRWNKDAEE